jgi:hypothetical protein
MLQQQRLLSLLFVGEHHSSFIMHIPHDITVGSLNQHGTLWDAMKVNGQYYLARFLVTHTWQ